ncbi:MacS family sensor histidine kinase [Nucisporomicrobium flavum]|jgi:signal transduction histidine kinase|uniref:MacS family sensor histidine kinase n=1 Tax=Nucisporomicrobium flavum TaxID=2785915 RepID=UPI003C2E5520
MAESSGLQTPLWRAIAVYRIAALVYVTILVVQNVSVYERPVLAWPVLALTAGWTVFTTYAYAVPARRRPPLFVADLVVTMAVMASSAWIVGPAALKDGKPTLAVAWHVAPVIAWAVAGGRRWGIAAALAMGATDLVVRNHYDQAAYTGTVLMLLAALAVGYMVGIAEVSQRRLERAIQMEAATRERERLARDIHDSVLQVLALVKRRGAGLDGEAGELARLAGEQEAALRTLVTGRTAAPVDANAEVDLMTLLEPYASSTVSVAAPAGAVRLPGHAATEIAAAVAAALDNVTRHCDPGTKVWVLVEDEPGSVTVSVRDDGCGIAPERLTEAEQQGRLGVAQSIRGRVADLDGTVTITSAPGQGTEVELRVPRPSIG